MEFYTAHDCEYENREYLCDGYDGVVHGFASPEDQTVLETYENGEILYIFYIWHGEDMDWGMYSYSEKAFDGWGGTYIWIPMDDLALLPARSVAQQTKSVTIQVTVPEEQEPEVCISQAVELEPEPVENPGLGVALKIGIVLLAALVVGFWFTLWKLRN